MNKIIYLLFVSIFIAKPSLALNIIQSNATTSSVATPILSGFAKNLPLKTVLKIIVPPYWNISATGDILEVPVTWKGGQNWIDSLTTIAAGHNLVINRDAKSKQITIIGFKKEPDFTILPTPKGSANIPSVPQNSLKKVTLPNPLKTNKTPIKTNTSALVYQPVTNKLPSPNTIKPFNIITNNKVICNIDCQKEALKLENYYKLKSLFSDLLNDFDYIFDRLEITKEYRKDSNTVRLNFSFNGVNKNEDMKYKSFKSFIVFTSNSAYSPFFKPEQFSTILDWYIKNFIHPKKPVSTKVLIKDLTLIKNNPTKSPTPQKILSQTKKNINSSMGSVKKSKSFLVNKYYVAKQGMMLSEVIHSWGEMNNISLIWNASNDFKVYKEIRFFSNFLQATNDIIQFYNNTSNPLQFRFFTKNKTILVEDLSIIHRRK